MPAAARPIALALAVASLLAGCGGGGGSREEGGGPGTLDAILERPGPDVALVPGTSDYAVGPVRVSFLVIRNDGEPVFRQRARVWVARARGEEPLVETTAALERVGVPGVSKLPPGEIEQLYVARFRLDEPGTYWIVAEPVGARIQAFQNLVVRKRPQAPAPGDRAVPSRTPTLRSTGGDLEALTTREPPDVELLRYSVAESLAARKPFVLVFATPKFCTSRTCGPVVDVADAVRKQFAGTGIRFIHVEIYEDNNPSKGLNRWVKEWRLPTEPYTFLVGRDGRIEASFEGSVSVAELAAAVRRLA